MDFNLNYLIYFFLLMQELKGTSVSGLKGTWACSAAL